MLKHRNKIGVATHWRPHWDEYVAIALLVFFLWKKFKSRLNLDSFLYWKGSGPDGGRSWRDYVKDGYVVLGRGGGELDEHARAGEERKSGQCCATLVARLLGKEKDPRLKPLLDATLEHDNHGRGGVFHVGAIIKAMHRTGEKRHGAEANHRRVLFWALDAVRALAFADRSKLAAPEKTGGLKVVFPRNRNRKLTIVLASKSPEAYRAAALLYLYGSRAGYSFRQVVDPHAEGIGGKNPMYFPIIEVWEDGKPPEGATTRNRQDKVIIGLPGKDNEKSLSKQVVEVLGVSWKSSLARGLLKGDPTNEVLHLSSVMRCMDACGTDAWKIVHFAVAALHARLEERSMAQKARSQFDRGDYDIFTVNTEVGDLRVVTATSDNPQLKEGMNHVVNGVHLLVQHNLDGHVQISAVRSNKLSDTQKEWLKDGLRHVVYQLRAGEHNDEIRRRKAEVMPSKLDGEGLVGDVWYSAGQMLRVMNGSETSPGTPATRLSPEQIRAIVRRALVKKSVAPC